MAVTQGIGNGLGLVISVARGDDWRLSLLTILRNLGGNGLDASSVRNSDGLSRVTLNASLTGAGVTLGGVTLNGVGESLVMVAMTSMKPAITLVSDAAGLRNSGHGSGDEEKNVAERNHFDDDKECVLKLPCGGGGFICVYFGVERVNSFRTCWFGS